MAYNVVLGHLPRLRSSTGESLLSGQQCPGILTLTCNAMNFGTSGLIGWYAGDQCLARFDIISDSLPYSVALASPLKATVQISSVSQSNSYFNFINFTLSAPVSNFIAIVQDPRDGFGDYHSSSPERSQQRSQQP